MKPPAFQFYAAEYLADEHVQLMTLEEEGAYIRLLAFCWREGSIPKAVDALSRLCKGASTTVLATVLKRFKPNESGERFIHPRLEAERKKQQEWREKSAQGGRASAHKRKKGKEINAEQGGSTKQQPSASTKRQAASFNTSSSSASSSSVASSSSSTKKETPSGITPQSNGDFTIWKLGVGKLMASCHLSEETAKGFITKQVRDYGKPAVAEAITQALAQEAIEPRSYIIQVLKNGTYKQNSNGGRDSASDFEFKPKAVIR